MTPAMVGLTTGLLAATVGGLLSGPQARGRGRGSPGPDPLARLGAWASRRLLRVLPSIVAVSDRELGLTLGLVVPLAVIAPPLAGLLIVGAGALALARTRRRRLLNARTLDRGIVALIDLLALAVAAGLPLRAAFASAGPRLSPQHGRLIEQLLVRVDQGESFASALRAYGSGLGPPGRELVAVLIASERDGSPLVAGLERAADAARRSQRRELERRARRLPVTMLLPLVVCILPAFVVLTLVPLLAGTLGDLQFPD